MRRLPAEKLLGGSAGEIAHPILDGDVLPIPPFPAASVYAGWGASHFAELWYVFDYLGQAPWTWSESDRKLAAAMSDYWVQFAKSGNPNGENRPPWRPFVGDDGPVQYLGESITSGTLSEMRRLKVFDDVYSGVRH